MKWGGIKYNVNSGARRAEATDADLETVNLSVQAELATYYFSLRGLDAEKELLDETVKAYEKTLERTENRFDGGIASKGDVAKAETPFETTAPKPSM